MKIKSAPTIALICSTLALLALNGCGDDSKIETEAKAVEKKAEQDFDQTKQALSREVKEATEGFADLADSTKAQAGEVQKQAAAASSQTQAAVNDAQANVATAANTASTNVAASLSNFQKTLTAQLGESAANELENSLSALKQQAASELVNSQVDSLSRSLGNGDVNTSLSSLSSLAGLAGDGKVNPVTLKDVVSLSAASILSDSFGGEGSTTPSLIESAIANLKDSKLLDGAKNLVQSLNSKTTTMTASQQGVVNDLIDSSLPLLGSFGEQLQQLRQGQKAAQDTKDAVDAIKGMF